MFRGAVEWLTKRSVEQAMEECASSRRSLCVLRWNVTFWGQWQNCGGFCYDDHDDDDNDGDDNDKRRK